MAVLLTMQQRTLAAAALVALFVVPLTASQSQPARRMRAADADTIPLHLSATRVAYGADSLQFGELRLPAGNGPFPVAVVIHGGCYLSRYATLRNTAALSEALTDAGIATWNVEYRRYDHPGGGWPGTFTDIADAADHVRTLAKLHPLDLTRVVTTGHSAGGQLALWLASRKELKSGTAVYRANPLAVHGVVALGPITDMREYQTRQLRSCGNPAIESVLGGLPDAVPDRRLLVSPIERVPLGVRTILVAGDGDAIGSQSSLQAYAQAARSRGDSVEVRLGPDEGHFEVLAPFKQSGKAAMDAIKQLLGVRSN
ncbi:MAG: alpha/beta hydrolase [Phycisphaerae bacterium]|nr:alpha/beta hydrolase [Gemmatimonadaceae bacterium]